MHVLRRGYLTDWVFRDDIPRIALKIRENNSKLGSHGLKPCSYGTLILSKTPPIKPN